MKCRYYSVQGTSFLIFSLHGNFILSDAKSVNIRDKKKLRFPEVKKKTVIFTFIVDRFYTRLKIITINKYKCDF